MSKADRILAIAAERPLATLTEVARDVGTSREFIRHGRGAYSRGCRCDVCVKANTDGKRRWRASAKIEPGDPRHGTESAYRNFGCRCEPCKAAGRIANKRRYRAKKLDALGAAGVECNQAAPATPGQEGEAAYGSPPNSGAALKRAIPGKVGPLSVSTPLTATPTP